VCLACPVGTISTANGSSACSDCNKGLYAASGSSVVSHFSDIFKFPSLILVFWQCTACPAGSWGGKGLGSADECTSCGVGKYSAVTGAFRDGVCTACLAGKYSDKERGVQVFRVFYSKIAKKHEKRLFFDKIRDFVENGARVTDGILQIEQSELEKSGQSASERAIRERVELGVVVCEVGREGFVARVPDLGVEALGKLQNLRGDGLAAVRERGRPGFLAAVVQLGVVLGFG
jgi:hypothetical protein